MLTQERLKEILHYNPETGVFTNRINRGHVKAGAIAGGFDWEGYLKIKIDGRQYKSHRLAWLYIYGEMPPEHIDHVNGVCTDNRIANLRLATNAENQRNRGAPKNSTTGVKGVSWCPRDRRYRARINVYGKRKHLGLFDTVEDGAAAYAEAAKRYHGEFARAE